jgi:hypothetical protein
VLLYAILLQVQAADPVYASPALREFVARAAIENRAPPPSLAGYTANVESEIALILRDSLGRELVGQIEQLASRAEWERNGRYDLHVVGFRSQSIGAPYSALTWTRMWTVPTLYGNRLLIGFNEGLAWKRDTAEVRRRAERAGKAARDTTRDPYRVVHPLSVDRDRFYRFRGGDTVAQLYHGDRVIRIVRVDVEPVKGPRSNFAAFRGELDFDADRHQLVRMRGRLVEVTTRKDPAIVRATGAVAIAFIEFENVEVDGKYWLPAFQWSEFQAQMALLGETRPIFRVISRFRNYRVSDSLVTLAQFDSVTPALPPTRANLTFASKDSVSRFGAWEENLGGASGRVNGDAFADMAPDVWKSSGPPRVDYFPRRFEDVVRYNRVEGLFTGLGASLRFRDLAPGLSARGNIGIAWTEQTARGGASMSLSRGKWITSARAERSLASTNDFMLAMESGLSIGPLISGVDDHDYVDRWIGAASAARILRHVDLAMLTGELAYVSDRAERSRLPSAAFHRSLFRPNRGATTGDYGRLGVALELHPNVTGGTLAPGAGVRLLYEVATGDLDWQRAEVRLAGRKYWRGLVFASRLDAGAVFGPALPPQVLYELGGGLDLPSYRYKEFGGDRAALGRALGAYHFPVLRTPLRINWLVIPGLSPGIGAGVQGGWAEASSDVARRALLALGGDGVTPLSRPTDGVRATADVRFTLLSGAIGAGFARPIDRAGKWKPFFVWGAAF